MDTAKEPKKPRDDSRFLMGMLATSLWVALPLFGLVARAEAVLIGWTVGFLVGYWLPPRPAMSFIRWTTERIVMIAFFYAVVLKTPPLVAPRLNAYLGLGIAFVVFLAIYFAWTRHPKSTLRFGRV